MYPIEYFIDSAGNLYSRRPLCNFSPRPQSACKHQNFDCCYCVIPTIVFQLLVLVLVAFVLRLLVRMYQKRKNVTFAETRQCEPPTLTAQPSVPKNQSISSLDSCFSDFSCDTFQKNCRICKHLYDECD